jgi:carboxypeptidase family protein
MWIATRSSLIGALLLVVGRQLASQTRSDERFGSIAGVAYDSLHGKPLPRATIAIESIGRADSNRTVMSDDAGRFSRAALPPGEYRLVLLHPMLDSLGLASPWLRVRVDAQRRVDSVVLAVPSFEKFWNLACQPHPPSDGGIVFGTVRDARGAAALPGVGISVRWVDLGLDPARGVTQRSWGGETHSDDRGNYALCGVPLGLVLRVAAAMDTRSTGQLDVNLGVDRLLRRDLVIGTPAGDSSNHAVLTGFVQSSVGGPVEGARVVLEGGAEARTDGTGHFVLPRVPSGTRQVNVTAIGATPTGVIVDIAERDTTAVLVELSRVARLAPIEVRGTSAWRASVLREISDRRRLGFGGFMDSTRLSIYDTMRPAIQMLWAKDFCAVYVDGRPAELSELQLRHPRDIALIEVLRPFEAPARFRDLPSVSPDGARLPRRGECSTRILLIWTKALVE